MLLKNIKYQIQFFTLVALGVSTAFASCDINIKNNSVLDFEVYDISTKVAHLYTPNGKNQSTIAYKQSTLKISSSTTHGFAGGKFKLRKASGGDSCEYGYAITPPSCITAITLLTNNCSVWASTPTFTGNTITISKYE